MAFSAAMQQKIQDFQNQAGRAASADFTRQYGGAIGSQTMGLDRDQTLTGRIQMQAEQAERETARAAKLRELSTLLEENPVTARILDLLGEVRGI